MAKKFEDDKVVRVALELGYQPYGQNRSARKHFYWYLPDCEENQSADFGVNFFEGRPGYRVGHEGTTHQPTAIKWLRELAKRTPRI